MALPSFSDNIFVTQCQMSFLWNGGECGLENLPFRALTICQNWPTGAAISSAKGIRQ